MKEVDWSNAPVGATHLYELSGEWYCLTQKSLLVWCNGWLPSGSPERIPELVEIPKAWSGEGLPPIGTICEWFSYEYGWLGGKVVGHDNDVTIVRHNAGYEGCHSHRIRPIKTPEQLAAEKAREAALDKMYGIITSIERKDNKNDMVEALYDAGYRLTKIEE